jgi:hypothetical protein
LKAYDKILAETGYPLVYLVSPEQFEHVEGDKIHSDYGISAVTAPVFTIHKGLRGKVQANTLWHELLHILFPSWEHWRVELVAQRMARGGVDVNWDSYAKKYGHDLSEIPGREEMLKQIRKQVRKFNERWRKDVQQETATKEI